MVMIETKYFGYCKICRIVGPSPKQVAQDKTQTDINFMKTNTIQVITTTVAVALVAGFGSTKLTGDYLTGVTVSVAYLAVAALVAMAAADYRRQSTYSA